MTGDKHGPETRLKLLFHFLFFIFMDAITEEYLKDWSIILLNSSKDARTAKSLKSQLIIDTFKFAEFPDYG